MLCWPIFQRNILCWQSCKLKCHCLNPANIQTAEHTYWRNELYSGDILIFLWQFQKEQHTDWGCAEFASQHHTFNQSIDSTLSTMKIFMSLNFVTWIKNSTHLWFSTLLQNQLWFIILVTCTWISANKLFLYYYDIDRQDMGEYDRWRSMMSI